MDRKDSSSRSDERISRREINRKYYLKNKERIIKHNNEYEKNEKIKKDLLELKNESEGLVWFFKELPELNGTVQCKCGGTYRRSDAMRHNQTKTHKNYIRTNFIEIRHLIYYKFRKVGKEKVKNVPKEEQSYVSFK